MRKFVLLVSLLFITLGLVACFGSENGDELNSYEHYNDYEPDEPEYTPTIEHPDESEIEELPQMELQMKPADAAFLATFDSYYEIDYRDVYIAHWGVDLDWLTFRSDAMILSNQILQSFQLIGIYLDHSDNGMLASMTHSYYEIPILDAPLIINWFFTAGMFPNNGISFIDANGDRRFFAIWAAYGYEGAEPFTLMEFEDGGYLMQWESE